MHRFFPSLLLAFAGFSSFAAEKAGSLVTLVGSMHATVEGGEKRVLRVGDPFFQGETLETAPASSAKLLFTDRTLMDLGEKSAFRVEAYRLRGGADREVEMEMRYGKIRAIVNQKVSGPGRFRVRTKSATMGVRGTEFVVKSEESGSSQVTVLEGGVSVTAVDGSVLSLSAGNQLRAGGDAPPSVTTLSAEEVRGVRESARSEDRSFQDAVSLEGGGEGSGGGGLSTLASVSTGLEAASAKDPASSVASFRPGPFLPLNPNFQGGSQLPPPPPLQDSRVRLRVSFTP